MKKIFLTALTTSIVIISGFIYFVAKITQKETAVIASACVPNNLSGRLVFENIAFFEGRNLLVPGVAFSDNESFVLGSQNVSERWIEVDLSEQRLKAWEGNRLFLETPVSTGLPWWPTPTGEFRIWIKLRATKMEGGEGKYYYYLPNVPYVMYFENEQIPGWRGFGLHGTYWHDDFGTQRSHGCVNLPTEIAERLYYWVAPELPAEGRSVKSTSDNPGTRVIIHE